MMSQAKQRIFELKSQKAFLKVTGMLDEKLEKLIEDEIAMLQEMDDGKPQED
jgi:hypothetical protein